YYGDEIGMRYVPGLPDKEGAQLGTQARQGSRTPMQWDDTPGAGFSTAPADQFYLPIDQDPDRPSVAEQETQEDSLLNQVRRLIALRREIPALGTGGTVEVLSDGYPFAYVRGGTYLVVVNPRAKAASLDVAGLTGARLLAGHGGVAIGTDTLDVEPFSYGVFELAEPR
ncbi:MAG TPA: DUF3459 domain-containing protein, partial [Thermoleophilia bacterium]|nr:DUF3459 domain-containing protein [Thermoleophilia bacterium]